MHTPAATTGDGVHFFCFQSAFRQRAEFRLRAALNTITQLLIEQTSKFCPFLFAVYNFLSAE
jgi:hypothetical protein